MTFKCKIESSFVPGCPFTIICNPETYVIFLRKTNLISRTRLNQYNIAYGQNFSVWM